MPVRSRRSVGVVAVFIGVLWALTLPATAQECEPGWQPGFGVRGVTMPPNGRVNAMVAWDDGTGEALYVAGAFTIAGQQSVINIAKWDGRRWRALGDGSGPDREVYCLAVYDDGSGEALYVGGWFRDIGGERLWNIARWDGRAWSGVGGGLDGPALAFAVFTDDAGPALYVCGGIGHAGGMPTRGVARWNRDGWSAVGDGLLYAPSTLAVFDDGSGPALYAGGEQRRASASTLSLVTRWDGHAWEEIGTTIQDGTVVDLAVAEDRTGPGLFAAGTSIGSEGLESWTYRWNGAAWQRLPDFEGGIVHGLGAYDDSSGESLVALGTFSDAARRAFWRLARWDGEAWIPFGEASDRADAYFASDLATFDDGAGEATFVGGFFTNIGGVAASNVARFDGEGWSALGEELGVDRGIAKLLAWDDGAGKAIYAVGSFFAAGDAIANRVARWDGQAWSALIDENGINGLGSQAFAVGTFDDGNGEALYVGGFFSEAGGKPARNIARWDGRRWEALGEGLGERPFAMLAYDDGAGPALFVGGAFFSAGGVLSSRMARWDGRQWSATGPHFSGSVYALAAFDDGSGTKLYAAGAFEEVGGQAVRRIASWNGLRWAPLPGEYSGVNGSIYALEVFNDGEGDALYVGGAFSRAATGPAHHIAKWDGTRWSPVGDGLTGDVYDLEVIDLGDGPRLVASGGFSFDGGLTYRGVAAWDGHEWAPIELGVNHGVDAIAAIDFGQGPELYAGGTFTAFDGRPAGYFARLKTCGRACVADLDGDGVLTVYDSLAFQNLFEAGDERADLDGDGALTVLDFLAFQAAFAAGCP